MLHHKRKHLKESVMFTEDIMTVQWNQTCATTVQTIKLYSHRTFHHEWLHQGNHYTLTEPHAHTSICCVNVTPQWMTSCVRSVVHKYSNRLQKHFLSSCSFVSVGTVCIIIIFLKFWLIYEKWPERQAWHCSTFSLLSLSCLKITKTTIKPILLTSIACVSPSLTYVPLGHRSSIVV